MLEQNAREFCVSLMNGFVKTGIGQVGVLFEQRQCVLRISFVTALAHRFL